jgi:DNA (cytosine-5)-methyltransferase 1
MLRTIDLFSGCGGLARGLHEVCEPALYVDIRPGCRATLERNFERGYLSPAPIASDIRAVLEDGTLDGLEGSVDMVCAGFPCTNITVCGDRTGLRGERSGLLRETLRVVERVRPQYVFLENVPNIVNMHDCLGLIFERLGPSYDLAWLIVSAAELGAPHLRKRWFCLATQCGAPRPSKLPIEIHTDKGPWNPSHGRIFRPGRRKWEVDLPRMVYKDTHHDRERVTMLGNACVPAQAAHAFRLLASGALESMPEEKKTRPGRLPFWGVRPAGGEVRGIARPRSPPRRDHGLVLLPRDPVPTRQRLSARVTRPVHLRCWGTPRAGMGYASSGHATGISRNLTERAKGSIPVQMRFERDTVRGFEGRLMNPSYLEWVMGMPPDFTVFEG